MRAVYRRLICNSRSDKFTIIPIGDTHLGAKNVDKRKLVGLVDYVKRSPNTYWIGMGDAVDAINFSDVRFSPRGVDGIEDLDDLCHVQAMEFCKIMKPIANKCLGMLEGNHELKIRMKYHQDIHARICHTLGVDNLTYATMMRIYFLRKTKAEKNAGKNIVIYAHHGHGGARAVAGKLNAVLNKAKSYDADIYLLGHVHLKANLDGERIYMSHGRSGEPFIYARKQLFATTGSFMLTHGENYSPYSEIAGYDPIPTGFIKIFLEPFKQQRVDGKSRDLYPHIHMAI